MCLQVLTTLERRSYSPTSISLMLRVGSTTSTSPVTMPERNYFVSRSTNKLTSQSSRASRTRNRRLGIGPNLAPVRHDCARAGSRTLNLGIKSLLIRSQRLELAIAGAYREQARFQITHAWLDARDLNRQPHGPSLCVLRLAASG